MSQPRNTRSFTELFAGFDVTLREYLLDRPRAYYEGLRSKFDNLPETNFDLGCKFASEGKWVDASFRFKFALFLQPDFAQAHYNLGCCYLQLNKFDQARDAFVKTLKLKPDHVEARFMLSGVSPQSLPAESLPRTMPRDMVTGFFTQVAEQYDTLAETNQYQGPRLVAEGCKPFLTKTTGLHYVEFGCGTGLIARPWRGLCREILGVDITHAMVNAAQVARSGDNPTFDRVLEADVNALEPGTFMPGVTDVVVCCDTAQFLGDLAPVVKASASALAPGGLFVLTIEPHNAPRGYGVNPATGRFGHTVDYVTSVAQAAGLELKREARVALYTQLQAHLFVFAKAGV